MLMNLILEQGSGRVVDLVIIIAHNAYDHLEIEF